MSDCPHTELFEDLCTLCGTTVHVGKSQAKYIHRDGLTLHHKVVQREDTELQRDMRRQRKLFLILDLDNTLLHATREYHAQALVHPALPHHIHHTHLVAANISLLVNFRPHVTEFLQQCHPLFHMYIYTMGTKVYATEMAKVLDPSGKLFGNGRRVLSRDTFPHATKVNAKYLEGVLSCNENMLLILDDRDDVWNFSNNVLRVYPYNFFTEQRIAEAVTWRQKVEAAEKLSGQIQERVLAKCAAPVQQPEMGFGEEERPGEGEEQGGVNHDGDQPPPKPQCQAQAGGGKEQTPRPASAVPCVPAPPPPRSLLEDDRHLLDVLHLLKNAHQIFFDECQGAKSITSILTDIRKQTLRNCVLCFSGVVPTGTSPTDTPFWKLALAFGAECTLDLHPRVTHLVCTVPKTKKHHLALRKGIAVVRLRWLVDSCWAFQRKDEAEYELSEPAPEDLRLPVPGVGQANADEERPAKRARLEGEFFGMVEAEEALGDSNHEHPSDGESHESRHDDEEEGGEAQNSDLSSDEGVDDFLAGVERGMGRD